MTGCFATINMITIDKQLSKVRSNLEFGETPNSSHVFLLPKTQFYSQNCLISTELELEREIPGNRNVRS